MKTVDEMYRGSFFSKRHKLSWRVPHVCGAICKILKPVSLVDVGCGIGDYVKGFIDRGVDACGIEGSINCIPYIVVLRDRILIRDMRKVVMGVQRFNLALCLEVLEHIDENSARIAVYNLSNMSDRILTSAAPPGQGGHYHVNCQPREYWIDLFGKYDYKYNQNVGDEVRKEWESVKYKKEMSAYYNNLLYFERGENV